MIKLLSGLSPISIILLISIIFLSLGILVFILYRKLNKAIAERDKMYHKYIDAENRLSKSEKLQSAFLANMSHEIRTPLNSIVGFSQLLTADIDDKDSNAIKYCHIIENNSGFLVKIINDVLELATIEAGTAPICKKDYDVAELFEKLETDFSTIPRNANVSLNITHPYKKCIVHGDPNRLVQQIYNFYHNATKFTSEGSIEIGYVQIDHAQYPLPDEKVKELSTKSEEDKEYNAFGILFYVKDTGIGIKADLQQKVFERFYKIDDFSQGVGLSLCINKAMVEGCEGRIDVCSTEGQGSTFWTWFPCDLKITK